jgi:valyl-tRNA synthetase
MQESRAANLKAFINYNPADIAELMLSGTSPFSEQTLRDAQQYYPEFMAQVNAEKKKKQTQQNVNAIASGGEMTTDTNGQYNINNNINNFATQNATSTKSSVEITKDVNNAMAESQTANEASETMASIEEDMAILKNRMKNLRQEANAAFK